MISEAQEAGQLTQPVLLENEARTWPELTFEYLCNTAEGFRKDQLRQNAAPLRHHLRDDEPSLQMIQTLEDTGHQHEEQTVSH